MLIDRRRFLAAAGSSVVAATALKAIPTTDRDTPTLEGNSFARWSEVRDQFDQLSPDVIHMSSFFLVSHPRPVREAIEKHRRGIDNDPFTYVEEHVYKMPGIIQAAAAEYLGGKPEEVALTNSTTLGLALVYQGMKLKPGDEVITTTHDHFVHHEAVRLATKQSGASMRKIALYVDSSKAAKDEIVGRIKAAITPKSKAIGITWVHSSTGVKLPIRKIAEMVASVNRERSEGDRVLVVVDGVHGFGIEDEPVAGTGVDFFAAGTHKWMFGPRGTGILWGKAESWKRLDMVIPAFTMETFGAWMSGRELTDPMRASWINQGGFRAFEYEWALPAAFEFHKAIGRPSIARRIHELNDQCKEGLSKMDHIHLHTPKGSSLSAGIISFDVKGMKPDAAVHALYGKKVIASTSPYAVQTVRVAPSIVNTPEEVDRTLEAIRGLRAM